MNVQRPADNREVVDLDAQTVTLQAMCCHCGQLRTVKYGGPRNYRPPHFWDEPSLKYPRERFTAELRCTQCRKVTKHAILRGDEHRDWAEKNLLDKPVFTHDEDLRVLLDMHIERLAEKAITVEIRDDWTPWPAGNASHITQWLHDGRWSVKLNAKHPLMHQVRYLLDAEKWIGNHFAARWYVKTETATTWPHRTMWVTVAMVTA